MSDFERKMLPAITRMKHSASQDLVGFREYYYLKSISERKKFRQDVQKAADTCRPFAASNVTIKVEFQSTGYCNLTGESISVKVSIEPKLLLIAIDDWDNSDEWLHS